MATRPPCVRCRFFTLPAEGKPLITYELPEPTRPEMPVGAGSAHLLADPLAVIGIFLLGAATGHVLGYTRYRRVLGEYRKAVEYLFVKDGGGAARSNFGMKALVSTRNPEVAGIFSHLFDELCIETPEPALESEVIDRLSSEKFEALVLDVDSIARCAQIVQSLRGIHPNQNVVVIAVVSAGQAKTAASAFGNAFIIERPLVPQQVKNLLRAVYGRVLRNFQSYFRLHVELPVSIQRASGTVFPCKTINLSQGGMAVKTPASFDIGERLNITFAIPNSDLLVSAQGTIIWDDKHGKAGISFECANPSVQARFVDWLQDHFFMRFESGTIQ